MYILLEGRQALLFLPKLNQLTFELQDPSLGAFKILLHCCDSRLFLGDDGAIVGDLLRRFGFEFLVLKAFLADEMTQSLDFRGQHRHFFLVFLQPLPFLLISQLKSIRENSNFLDFNHLIYQNIFHFSKQSTFKRLPQALDLARKSLNLPLLGGVALLQLGDGFLVSFD